MTGAPDLSPAPASPSLGARAVIYATILLDAIGMGLIYPLMPDLMARVGAPDLGAAAVQGGLLLTAYAAMQFLFAPIMGGLSDAFGRRPVLIAALATLALDYVVMALATSYGLLLVGRIISGIAGASYVTANAYLADITPPGQRAARFGLVGATFGLGFITGPAIGGLLAGGGVSLPFWTAAALAALNVVLALFVLPESLPPARRRALTRRDFNPFAALLAAARLPGLALPLGLYFIFKLTNAAYPTLWSFWTREAFGWSAAMIGASFAIYGIGAMVSQGLMLPRLVSRLGHRRTMALALVAGITAFVGIGAGPPEALVLVAIPLASVSDIFAPTAAAWMSQGVAEDRQGVLQGVLAALSSLAAMLAPLAATPLFRAFTGPEAAHQMPGAPFLAAAVLLAMTLPLLGRLRGRP